MAGKVPVGATISRAYGFAFGNIVNNFGLIWIPAAILWVATYLLQPPTAMQVQAQRDPQAALAQIPLLFGLSLIGFLIQSAQVAALTKEALGLRTGSAFVQFPFGAAMWRVFGSVLLFLLVMLVVYVGLLLVMVLGAGIGEAALRGNVLWVLGPMVVAILGALLYIATRLSFFLAPVAVAENKVSLVRAWQLTGGNFWRIFFVLFVILLPFVILELAFFAWLLMPFVGVFHANMAPQEVTTLQQEVVASIAGVTRGWWFVFYPVSLLVTLLFYGMITGASAFAYRAATHEDNSPDAF